MSTWTSMKDCVLYGLAGSVALSAVVAAEAGTMKTSVVEPLPGERWWGGAVELPSRDVKSKGQPYVCTRAPVDLARENFGSATMPLFVSSKGRYVWSDRPFTYAFTNGVLYLASKTETIVPVVAGTTLKEAYLAAMKAHFPFDGHTPAELLFTKPQWNNWIEIATFGMNQKVVDAYTDAIAANGFPCGVYTMDGGWLTHQGSYAFYAPDFPDPEGMFARIRSHGWKSMIWTAHFISPDSREHKRLRYGANYASEDGPRDVLAYRKPREGEPPSRKVGVVWWWSGVSAVWDLTYPPGFDDYVKTLKDFAAKYGIDGFKFDAGDPARLDDDVVFHDPSREAVDYAHDYLRVGAEHFPYNEYRAGFRNGGMAVMLRLLDTPHAWNALATINAKIIAGGLMGHPYMVADMVGGGLSSTYAPGSGFSEKLFLRMCAQQALHPCMQFSAAPWRYLSPKGLDACRKLAQLRCAYGPRIYALARHAAKTGEPIVRAMEYEFPGCGYEELRAQYMLGSDLLVANVVREDDSATVVLPKGRWCDDLGETHVGPKTLELTSVPLDRLPRYERVAGTDGNE